MIDVVLDNLQCQGIVPAVFLVSYSTWHCSFSSYLLTRCHSFSLLLLLGLISNPDKHLRIKKKQINKGLLWSLFFLWALILLWMHIVQQRQSACFLPAPRCPRSWHHQWQGHLGSSHLVPPQSEKKKMDLRRLYFYVHVTTNKDTVHCFQQVLWNILDILHMLVQYQRLENSSQNRTKPIQQEKKTYYKVSSLIGTSKETGWMSIHLVLESSGGAILRLSTQSLPELICKTTETLQAITTIRICKRAKQ